MTSPFVAENSFPDFFSENLLIRHRIIKAIRLFFYKKGYIEVDTPIRIKSPVADPYVNALEAGKGFFLATSPELHMKRLLALKINRIFQITHAFRADEEGHLHSQEFSMLEWYRVNTDYSGIIQETQELLKFIIDKSGIKNPEWEFPFQRIKVDDLYKSIAGWEPSKQWDEDRYFRDWVDKIEPNLLQDGFFLMDFPAPLAALSKLNKPNPLVCERFELFLEGMEIGNAYTELTDYNEHKKRFKETRIKRALSGKKPYPLDLQFMEAIKSGIPDCAGIAVGVDRLVMALSGHKNINLVQTFPMSRM